MGHGSVCWNTTFIVGFGVLTVVLLKIQVFWDNGTVISQKMWLFSYSTLSTDQLPLVFMHIISGERCMLNSDLIATCPSFPPSIFLNLTVPTICVFTQFTACCLAAAHSMCNCGISFTHLHYYVYVSVFQWSTDYWFPVAIVVSLLHCQILNFSVS